MAPETTSESISVPNVASGAVLVKTDQECIGKDARVIRGYDFNQFSSTCPTTLSDILSSYGSTGFQASSLSQSIQVINDMLQWRLSDEPIAHDEIPELRDLQARKNVKCKIFLGYTSNLVSCGLREVIRFLVQHKLVDCLVTTAGGIEEDIIKCLKPTYLGDYHLSGKELRKKGINRTGNLLVPNDNYCDFEDWVTPVLDQMLKEQKEQGTVWTPSKIIHRLGKTINHPDSIYYWAEKNDIPVFCPALTDGSLGDMIYFHSFKNPGLVVDIVQDIRNINNLAVFAKKTGAIILGGGVVKHHINNANLMRNGSDFTVYINTAQEFDGSDSGARPDEAISWGKIRPNAKSIKVYSEATLVFPLIVAETFAKEWERQQQQKS